ncbi:SDR family oxidoreductase [Paraburkholderia sp. 5N]|uniref:SDR family oxidoreductase n=1 Tax=Paraburkholderia elongata TaxID=2675747 RepID=A0A972SNS5_9BURK|nr:SDR family oxidoreductase [Paraburkholderia elongata]
MRLSLRLTLIVQAPRRPSPRLRFKGRAIAGALDVADETGWESAIPHTLVAFGKFDIACNIAGIGAPIDFQELTLDQWNREIAVNLTGVFLGCSKACAPSNRQLVASFEAGFVQSGRTNPMRKSMSGVAC